MGVGLDSSIVDDVFSEWSFFMFPFVDVFRSNKTCIVVFQIITLGGFRFFIFHEGLLHLLGTRRLFLVHLSGLWVAIRRACRHTSFFSVSTPFVTLYRSIFSSASFVLLFMSLIQRSEPSSWLAVLSCSLPIQR